MITTEQAEKVREIVSGFDNEKKSQFLEKYSALDTKKKEIIISRLIESQVTPQVEDKSDYMSGVKERGVQAQKDITSRGTIQGNILKSASSDRPFVKYGITGLQTIGAPFTAFQAGISNPALAMQQGNFNPIDLAKESALGISGQKLGEYGDVYRTAIPGGAGKVAGVVGGLTLDVAGPIKALKTINKTFGGISRMSDAGILKAGDSLVQATKNAENFAGTKLNNAFNKVDSVKVDPQKFLDEASKLPSILIKKMEEKFGNLDELAQNMTVGKLRQFKQMLGKFNPSAFGKETRGLTENIQADDINNAYSATKKLLTESVTKGVGQKAADKLLKLEEAFTEVSRASDSVKRTVIDPILLKATKAGNMAGKLVKEGDVTGRMAMNTLKKSGPKAMKEINRAVRALENFNRIQSYSEIGKHILNAATYGGAIGAAGSAGYNLIRQKFSGEDF